MRTTLALLALSAGLCAQRLGPMPAPPENPTTAAKVVLGKILFWEEQLAGDDSMACGTCHRPESGGSDGRATVGLHPGADGVFGTADDIRGSVSLVRQANDGDFTPATGFGLQPQATARTTPSAVGAGHFRNLNWDGAVSDRFVDPETSTVAIAHGGTLEHQALLPILDPTEMGFLGRTWADVRRKLRRVQPLRLARNLTPDIQTALQHHPDYPSLFQAAFGTRQITARRIAFAIASYERTLNPDDTPWDRFQAGDVQALTELERVGWKLMLTRGRCLDCHRPPLFSDGRFHALGLRPANEDPGAGQGTFRTPSLRNTALRPRLFHNGQSAPLGHPTQFWDIGSTLNAHWRGGGAIPTQASPSLPDLQALGVTQNEVALMLEFVRTGLTDARAANRLPPFDHPDLRSMVEPPPRLYGPSLPGQSEPFLIDWVPPYPGNARFKLGLVGGQPGSVALLLIGFGSHEPPLTVQGLPWNVDVFTWMVFALGGQAGGPGHATWHVPLPDLPALATVPLYYQMLVNDPSAPGGVAASQGSEFFIR